VFIGHHSIEESTIASVLQSAGEKLPKSIVRLMALTTNPGLVDLVSAINRSSVGGRIATLPDIARHMAPGRLQQLNTALTWEALPLALAEMEAETVVEKLEKELLSTRLAGLAQEAITRPDRAHAIGEEVKSLLLPQENIGNGDMHQLVHAACNRYEELSHQRWDTGTKMGFGSFDRVAGGLKPGQMTVVAAETGGGKSTFALNVVNHVLTNHGRVLLFTMEMDRHEIIDILMAINARVNRNGFNTGKFNPGEVERMTVHGPRLGRFPLVIDDRPAPTASDIAASMAGTGSDVRLVVIDYIQLVAPFDVKESREQQVAGIARALRAAAKTNKVPMLVLSQLNDEGKLRESRAIGHEAHIVMMISTEGDAMTAKIVKGRGVPKIVFTMDYTPEHALLEDHNPERF